MCIIKQKDYLLFLRPGSKNWSKSPVKKLLLHSNNKDYRVTEHSELEATHKDPTLKQTAHTVIETATLVL